MLNTIEVDQLAIALDDALPAVKVEIVDQLGNGFRLYLDQAETLDLILKLVGPLARLNKWDMLASEIEIPKA